MKRIIIWSTLGLSLLLLAGCATTASKAADAKVKCPACGYEFAIPDTPGN